MVFHDLEVSVSKHTFDIMFQLQYCFVFFFMTIVPFLNLLELLSVH